jgi:AraC family transcriptional regulator
LLEGTYGPSTKVTSHSHQPALFCMSLDGSTEESYAGKVRTYAPRMAGFLPSWHTHSLVFPRADIRVFIVDVPAHWLERAREYSLNVSDSVCDRGQLSSLMIRLYREFLIGDHASNLAIEGLASEMLAEVSRRSSRHVRLRRPGWLTQVINLLQERFQERTTIAEMAVAVGVHPVHLAREFRRFEHCTIGEYIRRLRIEQACRRLTDSTEPIAAIAAEAGFADQSHFARTFKRVVGMSPVQFRATLTTSHVLTEPGWWSG